MNKQIRDAISRFGEEACLMAYEFNVNQGEGGAFIETNTGIPKRSQGAAIAAGEYLSKRGKMNPRSSRDEMSSSSIAMLEKLTVIPPEAWLEEAERRERAGDKEGAKTARQFARFLMGQKDAFENPAHRPKESPLYVKYLSLMRGEEPFMMQGTKYEYVWAEYPGGIKDIGVYSYANDLVYSYDSFRKMMNLDRTNPVHSRNPKQRIGISLSKNRRQNPVYDTGSDE